MDRGYLFYNPQQYYGYALPGPLEDRIHLCKASSLRKQGSLQLPICHPLHDNIVGAVDEGVVLCGLFMTCVPGE